MITLFSLAYAEYS